MRSTHGGTPRRASTPRPASTKSALDRSRGRGSGRAPRPIQTSIPIAKSANLGAIFANLGAIFAIFGAIFVGCDLCLERSRARGRPRATPIQTSIAMAKSANLGAIFSRQPLWALGKSDIDVHRGRLAFVENPVIFKLEAFAGLDVAFTVEEAPPQRCIGIVE